MDGTKTESLDYAERYLRDGLRTLHPSLAVYQCSADMTKGLETLDALAKTGVRATPTHLLVSATARALAANPDLHQLVAGVRRQRPGRFDIGLSVRGDIFVDPVLVVEGADCKSIKDIAAEIERRTPEVRAADQKMLKVLRRWGWILPFGIARRAVFRMLFSSPAFRRRGVGTFQVSTTTVDWGLGASFSTAGLIVGSAVRSQVTVVNGQPAVRPIMKLTLSCDHGVWDGRAATRFLVAVQTELENGLGK